MCESFFFTIVFMLEIDFWIITEYIFINTRMKLVIPVCVLNCEADSISHFLDECKISIKYTLKADFKNRISSNTKQSIVLRQQVLMTNLQSNYRKINSASGVQINLISMLSRLMCTRELWQIFCC